MKLARRRFLRLIGGGLAAPAIAYSARSQTKDTSPANILPVDEPNPDFTYVPGLTPLAAALRPYRKTTYRLEEQIIDRKLVVHNYGHGGAGITMSWGCAQEVADIVIRRYPNPTGKPVAVLGAGVMGLTTATWLTEKLNMQVTMFAKRLIPQTTSNVAGGQWAASSVEFQKTIPSEEAKFVRILRRAHEEHSRRGSVYGVSSRPNYSPRLLDGFEYVPHDIVPRVYLNRLPFDPMNRSGWEYSTLLIEPPIFLMKLQKELQKNGVRFVNTEFFKEEQVLALAPEIIINCTGLGSHAIWPDPLLTPIKGQLVLLPAQPKLKYLFSGDGYVFPRADCTVVGGTYETSFTDETPDPQRCEELVKYAKDVFDGGLPIAPEWLIRNE